jgi:hypothetical protein
MPLTIAQVEKWIDDNGTRFHYYVGFEQNLPWIKRDGLIPRSETQHPNFHANLPSREDHVYLLATDSLVHRLRAGNCGVPQIAIEIRQLNYELFAVDEDRIEAHSLSPSERVRELPGYDNLDERLSDEDVGSWSRRNTAVIDSPAWVEFSMRRGSLSYRGRIAPELLRIDPDVDAEWDRADEGDPWPGIGLRPDCRYRR